MSRPNRNGLMAFLALLLAGIAILLLVSTSRGVSGLGWSPWAGPMSSFPGSVVPAQSGGKPTPTSAALPPSSAPTTAPQATRKPKPSVRPTGEIGTAVGALKGQATWFASLGSWDYGAAGPRLRAAMGNYLGRFVRVCAGSRCVVVKLVTSCACQPDTRLIDLSRSAFSRLGDPSVGVLEVTVSW